MLSAPRVNQNGTLVEKHWSIATAGPSHATPVDVIHMQLQYHVTLVVFVMSCDFETIVTF